MAIEFTNVKWKNFLSTGNDWTSVPLNSHKSTLIQGINGSGKCLSPRTFIDIQINDEEVRDIFEEFMRGRKYAGV